MFLNFRANLAFHPKRKNGAHFLVVAHIWGRRAFVLSRRSTSQKLKYKTREKISVHAESIENIKGH